MIKKNLLMPHSCQKVGWWLLLLSVLLVGVKVFLFYTTKNIGVAWYLAKSTHLLLIVSLFFICLSKEKVEDEMIASMRLKAVGITAYAFFVLFLIVSIILELKPYRIQWDDEGYLPEFLSEFFLISLPILLFGLYCVIFKGMILHSKKGQVL